MTTTNATGVHNLPVPGSKSAPKKFKGKFSDVKPFLKHYEKLCMQKGIVDEEEKIQNLTQYCSRKVREFLEGLPSYTDENWEAFVQDIWEYYDAEKDTKRFKRGDLESFSRRAKNDRVPMRLSKWKEYNRDFIRIAGWLEGKSKISSEEKDLYYWKGIPSDFRDKLESRLLAVDPGHDLEIPFKVEEVNKVAKSFLQRNRFDSDRVNSDSEPEKSESETQRSDSSDTDTDEESLNKRSSKKSSHSDKKRSKNNNNEESSKVRQKEPKVSEKKAKEVEELIQQMNKLSLHDPTYSVLYYRAYQLDPFIGQVMQKPIERQQMSSNILYRRQGNLRNDRPPTNNGPPADTNPNVRQTPPHLEGKAGSNAFQQPPRDAKRCYGCGKSGHTTFECGEMGELEKQGIVRRDQTGRYVMADGSIIRRTAFDEPLVEAAKRAQPAQVNYVALGPDEKTILGFESDTEDEDVLAITRSQGGKKEKLTKRRTRNSAEQIPVPLKRRVRITNRSPLGEDESDKSSEEEDLLVPKIPTPITIDNTVFNPEREEEMMDEIVQVHNTDKRPRPVLKRKQRKSEIQSQVSIMKILTHIMDQQTTLSLRDLIGASKELAYQLREALKPKTIDIPEEVFVNQVEVLKNPTVAAVTIPRARERLIKLEMECRGKPVTAIIDTGSQLNIAHSRIWKNTLKRPIGKDGAVNMNDANGGTSRLRGIVKNLTLNCGDVETKASVHIGDKVPFDLLLGRPWQRGNLVTIDEREEGTYLMFKDKNFEVTHELLVTPEEYDPNDPEVSEFLAEIRGEKAAVNAVFLDDEDKGTSQPNEVGGSEESIPQEPTDPEKDAGKDRSPLGTGDVVPIKDTEAESEGVTPPGLLIPQNLPERLNLEDIWSQTLKDPEWRIRLGLQPNNPECENDSTRNELAGSSKNEFDTELTWNLVQVLEKSSTKKWRKDANLPKDFYNPLALAKTKKKEKSKPLRDRVISRKSTRSIRRGRKLPEVVRKSIRDKTKSTNQYEFPSFDWDL